MTAPERQNNFDLIRLLAAIQVVLAHAIGHTGLVAQLDGWGRTCFEALLMLPGVPVFFVISGFLITQSYERNPSDLTGYLWRRGLRIFPAMWVCLGITLLALGIFGFLGADFLKQSKFWAWLAGQVSFFQFYNPEHFREFGIGVANGALWTITVELQFYALVPLLHWFTRRDCTRRKFATMLQTLIFFSSFALFCVMDHKVNGPGGFSGAPLIWKLTHVTLAPHLWMFMLGMFIHWNFGRLKPWLEGRFVWYALGYAAFVWAVVSFSGGRTLPFYLAYFPARVLLAMGTIAAAFTAKSLASRLLRGNDFSYGIYLYHSVVINVLVETNLANDLSSVFLVLAISAALAVASWHCVEKPALALKPSSPRRRNPVAGAIQ